MKIIRFLKGFAWWIAMAAALAFSLCFALPALMDQGQPTPQKTVLTIWNVDTFEGGKGSRTTFLNTVAKELEKDGKSIYMVFSKTLEGLDSAFQKGEMPDMLSFGLGVDVSMKNQAYCWCMGKYALFSKVGQSVEANSSNTVMSDSSTSSMKFCAYSLPAMRLPKRCRPKPSWMHCCRMPPSSTSRSMIRTFSAPA